MHYAVLMYRMNENMEFPGISGEDIQWLQDSFVETIFKRVEVRNMSGNIWYLQ